MDVTIVPNKLQGRVTPPPSKSQTHRVILAAALARGRSRLELSLIHIFGRSVPKKSEMFWTPKRDSSSWRR